MASYGSIAEVPLMLLLFVHKFGLCGLIVEYVVVATYILNVYTFSDFHSD